MPEQQGDLFKHEPLPPPSKLALNPFRIRPVPEPKKEKEIVIPPGLDDPNLYRAALKIPIKTKPRYYDPKEASVIFGAMEDCKKNNVPFPPELQHFRKILDEESDSDTLHRGW